MAATPISALEHTATASGEREAHQSFTAPISTLPVELLVDVFVLTICDDAPPQLIHFKQVFRISHVCAHWRQVAHGAPQLWTGLIEIFYGRLATMSTHTYIEGMKDWLARSAPLPVSISTFNRTDNPDWGEMSPIFDELLKISPRWRSFRIYGPVPLAFLRRMSEYEKESLEEVDLGSDLSRLYDPGTTLSFGTTPRLRKLRMVGNPPCSMPWTQLTNLQLSLDASSPPELSLVILARCSNLVDASIFIYSPAALPELETDIFTLHQLSTLSFDLSFAPGNFMLLLHLRAPALKHLRLRLDWDMEWTDAQFTAFQQRSPNITQLEISFSELTSDDLRAALAHAPSLTHLSVINCPRCIGDGLTSALLYRDGFAPLVPSLRSLVLDFCGNGLSEIVLADMIMSRWRATPSLSSPPAVARWTYLRFLGTRSSFSQYFMDIIENARRQGLEFHSL